MQRGVCVAAVAMVGIGWCNFAVSAYKVSESVSVPNMGEAKK